MKHKFKKADNDGENISLNPYQTLTKKEIKEFIKI